MSSADHDRQRRLQRFLEAALRDTSKISSVTRAQLFIEAICTSSDLVHVAAMILDFPSGRQALNLSVRQDTSPRFVQEHSFKLLDRFSAPEISAINCGETRREILAALLRPSFFFIACIDHLKRRMLSPDAACSVAWFVSEAVSLLSADELLIRLSALSDPTLATSLLSPESPPILRQYGYAIKQKVDRATSGQDAQGLTDGPGGRHDNDAKAIKDIALLPTPDEILSKQPAYLKSFKEVFTPTVAERSSEAYRDHMFRLFREDLVETFREPLQSPAGTQKRNTFKIYSTELVGVCSDNVDEAKPWLWQPWALNFQAAGPIPGTESMTPKQRLHFLRDFTGRGAKILRPGSLISICHKAEIFGFGYVRRDPDALAAETPLIALQLTKETIAAVLLQACNGHKFDLIQIDSPTFAYEPFLSRIQRMPHIDFCDILLGKAHHSRDACTSGQLRRVIKASADNDMPILRSLLDNKSLDLDASQRAALCHGLSQRIAIIQGPPGTGKSFIGSLITKALLDHQSGVILVICFTNHALDQYTEDLLDMGVDANSIIRLGSKSSPRTEPLLLKAQQQSIRLSSGQWAAINDRKYGLRIDSFQLETKLDALRSHVADREILEHLEFLDDGQFYEALRVPDEEDDMVLVGKRGRKVGPSYLLHRWDKNASDAGVFSNHPTIGQSSIWTLSPAARKSLRSIWTSAIRKEGIRDFCAAGSSYDAAVKSTRDAFRSLNSDLLSRKKIIACTSTQAAMSADILDRVRPETVLLEEAGELLEPHVLTALNEHTERLIMIGDEKQLRPKIASYPLSVGSGKGFDLNRSLFERLILDGFDHVTLSKQHRMRPEISGLVRHLTYPDLEDAPSTLQRPAIRGLQRNVVFVSHHEPELARRDVLERQSGSSKQNPYEAQLALRYVKYLAQQGYKAEDMIVLTPYLAQLRLLQDTLSTENDAILNDLDSQELYRAGLLDSTAARSSGRRIHLSSIDNYQGEERKIVIASLTRSNEHGNIGFMAEPERLNVLLSRARDGLIVIGNFDTFTRSERGGNHWQRLWSYANDRGFIWNGLPIQCQTHPDVKTVVTKPEHFNELCPDGGCSQPWKAKEKRRRLAKRLLEQNDKDEADQRQYRQQIDALDDEISLLQEQEASAQAEEERQKTLALKKGDLEQARDQLRRVQDKAAQKTRDPVNATRQDDAIVDATATQTTNQDDKDNTTSLSSAHSSPSAQAEWERQKRSENQSNKAIDELMALVGLENIKEHILELKGQIEVKQRQGVDMFGERMHVTFVGNPGTGKTTVARLWAKLLFSLGVLEGEAFEETTGSKLANDGISAAQKHLDTITKAKGGIFFIDEAYQLVNGVSSNGRSVLDFLLAEIENRRGTVVFVFAGYKQPMETFYGHNPGIPSRIPLTFEFVDYTETDILTMLKNLFAKRFRGNAKIPDGPDGLYMRIVSRRLSRQRGKEGFGNMRDLENVFAIICRRQSRRINETRRSGTAPDDFAFTPEDLIGPEPSSTVFSSEAWKDLQHLIGLQTVKDSVKTLVDVLKTNYSRELQEKQPIEVSLNRLFLGSPGTGKTSVAKLYGRLLADIGLLSKGDVVIKTPTDFIGSVIGASEQNTNAILESSKGKVLVIDEFYALDAGGGIDGPARADPFRTAVVDTIVSKVHNVPGDDHCVLLLGYEDKMNDMFQRTNPGLSRRFPMEDAFRFEDFSEDELQRILNLKLGLADLDATNKGEQVAMEALSRARNLMNFGNAGEVDNLITRAKLNRQRRMLPSENGNFTLDAIDFDSDFDRAKSAASRVDDLFQDHVGFTSLVEQLKQYQRIAENVKRAGKRVEDHVPFNFIFKGPPGTGKTTTARKIGQVYYDMGLLRKVEVVETSVSDLVGEYVGHTGPKTTRQLEKALGRILFVDEAYRLSEGRFASEAISELTDLLTKPKFKGKSVVILGGYQDEMEGLLSVNPGLASRFPESIMFPPLTAAQCLDLFMQQLRQNSLQCPPLDDRSSSAALDVFEAFRQLAKLKYWGNARDVQNLGKRAMRHVYGRKAAPDEVISEIPASVVLSILQAELAGRLRTESRAGHTLSGPALPTAPPQLSSPHSAPPPPATSTSQSQAQATKQDAGASDASDAKSDASDSDNDDKPPTRDADVSDATWAQLQTDSAAAAHQATQNAAHLTRMRALARKAHETLSSREAHLAALKPDSDSSGADSDSSSDSDDDDDDNGPSERQKLMQEIAQLRIERQRAEDARRQEEARQAAEREREAAVQKRLALSGRCANGYAWVRQADGYRCQGGMHFVGHAQLGMWGFGGDGDS